MQGDYGEKDASIRLLNDRNSLRNSHNRIGKASNIFENMQKSSNSKSQYLNPNGKARKTQQENYSSLVKEETRNHVRKGSATMG